MKTPSFLLIAAALASALPASASERKPEQRCDTEFLESVVDAYSKRAGVDDPRITDANFVVDGKTYKRKVIAITERKACDASVEWHMSRGRADGWRNDKLRAAWSDSDAGGNAAILLLVDDFYRDFDAKALEAIASADEAIDNAARLGLVSAPPVGDDVPSLAKLLDGSDGRAASGGPLGAHRPRVVELLEAGKQNRSELSADQSGAAFRVLIDDGGAPGSGVLKFRTAVLGLGAALEAAGKSQVLVKKRLGDAEGIADFTPGIGSFKALPATKENLTDTAKYQAGLHALVGESVVEQLDDKTEREGALLDKVDMGLRNLLAIRSQQLDAIMELAKGRLGGKSVSQYETAQRLAEERTTRKLEQNSLAAATLDALAANKDYADLDALYQAALRRAGGDASKLKPEEKAAGDALRRIQDAAATAATKTGDKAEISYTLDGKPDGRRVTMPSVVPADVEADEQTRRDVAGEIARDIVAGNLGDAKVAAALAALRGQEARPDPLPEGVDEPPVVADPVPKPQTAWDAVADSADAGCGVNPANLMRGKAERAALRQAERAAEDADQMSKDRRKIEEERLTALRKISGECDTAVEVIRTKPRSARLSAEEKQARIQEEINDAEIACNTRLDEEDAKFKSRLEAVSQATQDANVTSAMLRAESERAKWYAEGVPQALNELLEDYTGGDRRAKLVEATFDDEGVNDDIKAFFARLPASFAADCTKALGYEADPANGRFSDPAKLADPVAGEVETRCKASVEVHKDKIAAVKKSCDAEYEISAGRTGEMKFLKAPLKDALCATIASKVGSRAASGPAPAPVRRREIR